MRPIRVLLLSAVAVATLLFAAPDSAQAQRRLGGGVGGFNRGVGRGLGVGAGVARVPRFPAFRQGFVQGRGFARGLGGVGGLGYGGFNNGFAARRFRPQFIPVPQYVPVPIQSQGFGVNSFAAPVCQCCGQVLANGVGGFGY